MIVLLNYFALTLFAANFYQKNFSLVNSICFSLENVYVYTSEHHRKEKSNAKLIENIM